MHYGSITNPQTKAGRVYAFLKANRCTYFGGWFLTLHCETSAISTRVSEINAQLKGTGYEVDTDPRVEDGKQRWYYGLVPVGPPRLPGM